jgi:hypothetical protein
MKTLKDELTESAADYEAAGDTATAALLRHYAKGAAALQWRLFSLVGKLRAARIVLGEIPE